MNDNILLRAISQLFSESTLIAIIFGIAFLALQPRISKGIRKWLPNKWLAVYFGALLPYFGIATLFFLLKIITHIVSKLRFETNEAMPYNSSSTLIRVLLLGIVISLLYTLYYFIKELYLKKIKNNTRRRMVEFVIVIIIVYLPMILTQAIGDGKIDSQIFQTMAVWLPAPFGTALAILFYDYYSYLNGFKVRQNELQIAMLKQQVTQSQLDALSSKIKPHFLYNSLNSIAAFASIDGEKTRAMAFALAKLFKYSLNNEEKNYTNIGSEMDMVSLYLDVEKIRFEEKLNYTCTVQNQISNYLIPRNLLQPLVENAVKHGAGIDGVEINISIEKNKKGIIIQVRDSGEAFSSLNPGYGLRSIYEKLDILAKGNYEIAFFNEPKMVQIELFDLKFQGL